MINNRMVAFCHNSDQTVPVIIIKDKRIMCNQEYTSHMAKEKMECPVCGISVKIENLENHVRKVHPGKEVELPKIKKKKAKRAKVYLVGRAWPKWAALGVVLLVIIVIIAILALPGEEPEHANYAPDFYVVDVDGNPYNLNSRIGPRPILIEIFCTAGSPCKAMAPVLNNLSAHYGDRLEMISLSMSTEFEISEFRDTYSNDWTFAHVSSEIYEKYGSPGFPHFVVVDKKGIIRHETTGVVTLQELKNAIDPWT